MYVTVHTVLSYICAAHVFDSPEALPRASPQNPGQPSSLNLASPVPFSSTAFDRCDVAIYGIRYVAVYCRCARSKSRFRHVCTHSHSSRSRAPAADSVVTCPPVRPVHRGQDARYRRTWPPRTDAGLKSCVKHGRKQQSPPRPPVRTVGQSVSRSVGRAVFCVSCSYFDRIQCGIPAPPSQTNKIKGQQYKNVHSFTRVQSSFCPVPAGSSHGGGKEGRKGGQGQKSATGQLLCRAWWRCSSLMSS